MEAYFALFTSLDFHIVWALSSKFQNLLGARAGHLTKNCYCAKQFVILNYFIDLMLLLLSSYYTLCCKQMLVWVFFTKNNSGLRGTCKLVLHAPAVDLESFTSTQEIKKLYSRPKPYIPSTKAYSPRYLFCIFFLDCWFKRKRYPSAAEKQIEKKSRPKKYKILFNIS